MPGALGMAARNRSLNRTAQKYQSKRRLPTVWERIHNPKNAFQRPTSLSSRQAGSPRLRAPATEARALADVGITNPIFVATPPTFDSGGWLAGAIAAGDFNGDGKPDILISNECVSATDCTQSSVGVLLGNGDGTYQPVVNSNSGASFGSVAVGDFNRDGKLDLALISGCPDLGCTTGSVDILLGNGSGTFRPPVLYASGGNAFSVEAGDVNGDGKLDLVVVTGSGSAGVLLGNGDGTFQPTSPRHHFYVGRFGRLSRRLQR